MTLFILHKTRLLFFLLGINFISSCQNPKKEIKLEKEFSYAEVEQIDNLDPIYINCRAEQWISGQIFNNLLELDENMELYPVLVKDYKLSADSLTYIFELKKNIYFHKCTAFSDDSSREMTVKDVIFSFKRLEKFPHKNLLGKFVLQDKLTQQISDTAFIAIDKYNFKIHLDTIYPNFLELLALPNTKIVSQKAAKHFRRKFRTKPIGTGAFYLDTWTNDKEIILKKNQDYFKKGFPKIANIKISRINSQKEIAKQFQEKKLDMVYMDWQAWQKADLEIIKGDSGYFENLLATCYLGFLKDSLSQSQFSDENKRIKLAYSIDYQGLIDTVVPNFASLPQEGFVPPLLPNFAEKGAINLAKYYLNDSIKNELKSIYFTLDIEKSDENIARYLKKKWKKEGIYAKIRIHSSKELHTLIKNKQINCYLTHYHGKYADANSFFKQIYPSEDSLFDSLYLRNLHSDFNQKQEQNSIQLEQIIRKKAFVIPLFYEKIWFNIQPNIKGFEIQATNKLQLEYLIEE